MKSIHLFLLLVLIYSKGIFSQEVDSIVVNYIDYSVLTIADINCSNFEILLEDEQKRFTLKNKMEINKILNFISSLSGDTEKFPMDARLKMKFYSNSELLNEVCMSLHAIELNGRACCFSKKFFHYVEKLKHKYSKRR